MPPAVRDAFDRKVLRQGYILNLDGKVLVTGFFRNAYQVQVEDERGGYAIVHYRHAEAVSSRALQSQIVCGCAAGTVREPCAHIPAALFAILAAGQGAPIGQSYAASPWSLLALGLCRSHAGLDLRAAIHSPESTRLQGGDGRELLTVWVDGDGGPGWPGRSLLLPGWETDTRSNGFAAWARKEITSADHEALRQTAQAPSRRAEFGPIGELCRQAFLAASRPAIGRANAPLATRLDWMEAAGLFRLRLEASSGLKADGYLDCDQAYSFRNRFPQTVLGEGFAPEPEDGESVDPTARIEGWSKGLEIRPGGNGGLRIRPFAASSRGRRIFPTQEATGHKFGNLPMLPGIGFRALEIPPGGMVKRYTGWKTYAVESRDVTEFLAKYGPEFTSPRFDVDPLLMGGLHPVPVSELRIHVAERLDRRLRVSLDYRLGRPGAEAARLGLMDLKSMADAGQACLISPEGWVELASPAWSWLGRVKADDWHVDGDGTLSLWADAPWLIRIAVLHDPLRVSLTGIPAPELGALPSLGREAGPNPLPDTPLPDQGLRPYQVEGLRWLAHLVAVGASGILADDMGLGKTHQVMALAAWLHQRMGAGVRILVVCPTSVLYHWQAKLDAFHPELKAALYHGPGRAATALEARICVTSFGIARNDMDVLRARRFDLLVIDEIQNAKNRESETHRGFVGFPAASIIGLSGTPLENGPADVKNLFDLLLPGYFPGESQFRQEVLEPLERRQGEAQARDRFRALCRPFILRRHKRDVLKDLPDKVEETLHGDLAPDQAALYRECLERRGGPLLRALQDSGPHNLMHVFQLLNHLKQICNHPMSLPGAERGDREYASGKWDLFRYLLEQALEAGQKVVVFSQYLAMLGLMEAHLEKAGVGNATLTGSTRDRAGVLRRFAEDPDCRVFCCSLKAGGVGIDLTAASTVIHYDRWWNAARENQATDRVHRIGQHRNVQVFKLVTRGTIEERIDAIIRRKADFMDSLLPEDGEGALKLFTREALLELLRIDPV